MNEEASPVLSSVDGCVGLITLNRPHKFNCLSPQVFECMLDILRRHEADPAVRCILIEGVGDHFCTGADLDAVQHRRSEPAVLREYMRVGHRAMLALEASPLPVVVAVQGLCLAGGLELMLACDVALAAGNARFGDQHAQFGLVPGWGGSQRLPRIVGMRRAMHLFFTAQRIDAATALGWGLVNQVCEPDQLHATALAYGQGMGRRSRHGLASMKRLAREGADITLAKSLVMEEDIGLHALLHPDVTEGLAAFQERRDPAFK
jgi:enoyl-CoA hydratase